MKISLIISTWNRPHLLQWGLTSLARQEFTHEFELILLNDAFVEDIATKNLAMKYKDLLNIRYFHTGASKTQDIRREQCFALNYGIQQSTGDVIILTGPEMYHLSPNNIHNLITPFLENHKIITTPEESVSKDDGGQFLKNLEAGKPDDMGLFNGSRHLSNLYNFFMGIWKEQLIDMGGFDEDFTGWAYDDTDLASRLQADGCVYHHVDAKIMHLWHPRGGAKGPNYTANINHNKKLYQERQGIVKRNEGRLWGQNTFPGPV